MPNLQGIYGDKDIRQQVEKCVSIGVAINTEHLRKIIKEYNSMENIDIRNQKFKTLFDLLQSDIDWRNDMLRQQTDQVERDQPEDKKKKARLLAYLYDSNPEDSNSTEYEWLESYVRYDSTLAPEDRDMSLAYYDMDRIIYGSVQPMMASSN